MTTLETLCAERDRLMDAWLRANKGDSVVRSQLWRYLTDGSQAEHVPKQIRQAQATLLAEIHRLDTAQPATGRGDP